LLSRPEHAQIICNSLCEKINKKFNNIDIILSPALGGVIVGYEIGRQLNLETIFAERIDGKLLLRRGFQIKEDSNVLVVEDVITTGKSALECLDIVKINNANLIGYACIIDRSSNNITIKNQIISQMKFKIETFSEGKIPLDLKKITPIKPGSRNLSK
jgi:orotate phosphoribosyltransferase